MYDSTSKGDASLTRLTNVSLQADREAIEKQIADILAAEKMREDSVHLLEELRTLIEEGRKLLTDADAVPAMYSTLSDSFSGPLDRAAQLMPLGKENDEAVAELTAIANTAKQVQSDLSVRASLWTRFVDERDSATDELETKRVPLDVIERKPLRSYDEVAVDLEKLKVFFSRYFVYK